MKSKSIYQKSRRALWILRKEGSLTFLIHSLHWIQNRLRGQNIKYKAKIHTVAIYEDIIRTDLTKSPPAWKGTNRKSLVFNWIMSPPGPGSGGHLNIYRFIHFLENAGHTCRIYLYTAAQRGPIEGVKTFMGNSYPILNAEMYWLENEEEMKTADGIFSTNWETAYPVRNSIMPAKRFYFIQDFEPFFYPVGSHYSLAENTYKFGFYGITAGGWLAKKLKRDYGMETDYYDFCADASLYAYENTLHRKEILFYARPFTERRGFEIGVMALTLFHERHPEYIINMVGWDVSNYHLPFPYINLRTLELHELKALYNRCSAGLVISFTNMSLLPLELLQCGTIPVVNDGENNRLVSDNPYIHYSPNDPRSLFEALSKIVSNKQLPSYSKKAAESIVSSDWTTSGEKFVRIVEREMHRNG